ncbi:hypothetical protein Aperf_G00000051136 [Anoplocephala perfoliata]
MNFAISDSSPTSQAAAIAAVSLGQCSYIPVSQLVAANCLQGDYPLFSVIGGNLVPMNPAAHNFLLVALSLQQSISLASSTAGGYQMPLNTPGTYFLLSANTAPFNLSAPPTNPIGSSAPSATSIPAAQYPITQDPMAGLNNPQGLIPEVSQLPSLPTEHMPVQAQGANFTSTLNPDVPLLNPNFPSAPSPYIQGTAILSNPMFETSNPPETSRNFPHPTNPGYGPYETVPDYWYIDLRVPNIYWEIPGVSPGYHGIDRALASKICRQVDHYFSDYNLKHDRYLRQLMDSNGWVRLSDIAPFYRLAALTSKLDTIATALHYSTVVEVNCNQSHVRCRKNPTFWVLQGSQ